VISTHPRLSSPRKTGRSYEIRYILYDIIIPSTCIYVLTENAKNVIYFNHKSHDSRNTVVVYDKRNRRDSRASRKIAVPSDRQPSRRNTYFRYRIVSSSAIVMYVYAYYDIVRYRPSYHIKYNGRRRIEIIYFIVSPTRVGFAYIIKQKNVVRTECVPNNNIIII